VHPTTRRRHFSTALLFILIIATAACAGRSGGKAAQTGPGAQPAPRETVALPAGEARATQAEPAPADDPVVETLSRAQEEYDLGLEALRSGDTEAARGHFDSALEIFNNSDVPVDSSRRLQKAYDRMVDDIAALEWELDEPGGPAADAEPTPSEALDDITTDLSPEDAQRELETVSPETSEVTFDIPMVVNDKVLAWIDIFRNRSVFRSSFVGGFQRYGWYEPMIHRILEEEGLPSDLIFMAFLESTYKTSAYSRARAKGIWQFMTPTGRQYGLRVDRYVDERSHPEKSTRAAARYMKDLYATFGDWHLAIAAYNTGAGNIMRAQRRSGKTDYWDLAKTRYMRLETKNFVPAILALALMAKEPGKYGFEDLRHNEPLEYDRITVEGPARLSLVAKLAGVSEDEVKFLNPHLRLGVTPPDERNYELLVPAGTGPTFVAAYEALPDSEKIAKLDKFHTVRRGETLGIIASRYGTTVRQLTAANHIRNPHRISIGTQLIVPAIPGGGFASSSDTEAQDLSDGPYHVVRRGDTLSGISKAYRVSLRRILAWNDMTTRTVLRPGMKIRVSGDGGSAARTTSAAVERRDAAGPYHVVRRGETLYGISRRYGVALSDLLSWNDMDKRTVLQPGMKVVVNPSASVSQAGRVDVPGGGESAPDPAGRKISYRIRRGDNLFRIAMRYGTTVENLKAWNNIPGDEIRAGEILTIYPN